MEGYLLYIRIPVVWYTSELFGCTLPVGFNVWIPQIPLRGLFLSLNARAPCLVQGFIGL